MKLTKPQSDIFIPDQSPLEKAFKHTSHMAIAAHPDNIEIKAYEGVNKCFNHPAHSSGQNCL
jgi:hypothetical protein